MPGAASPSVRDLTPQRGGYQLKLVGGVQKKVRGVNPPPLRGVEKSLAWVQIAAATLSGNSLRQTVHTHRASVHQAAKLVAALFRVARATAGLAESNGSLPPGL